MQRVLGLEIARGTGLCGSFYDIPTISTSHQLFWQSRKGIWPWAWSSQCPLGGPASLACASGPRLAVILITNSRLRDNRISVHRAYYTSYIPPTQFTSCCFTWPNWCTDQICSCMLHLHIATAVLNILRTVNIIIIISNRQNCML